MTGPESERRQMEAFYREYAPRLTAYARSFGTGNGHAPEDVVQEVFLGLIRNRAEICEPSALPFLFRAVRHRLLNLQRSAGRRQKHERQRAAGTSCVFEVEPGREEETARLEAALARLPDEQREVVVMRIWGGMTLQQAAEVQEVPLKTAASRYDYGLRKLKAMMESHHER
jgi:RNA polymerase sigma-70 factor, ECF subfamily